MYQQSVSGDYLNGINVVLVEYFLFSLVYISLRMMPTLVIRVTMTSASRPYFVITHSRLLGGKKLAKN